MSWHCKSSGGYTTNTPVTRYPDADGIDNCIEIWNTLSARGWTANAVAGMLTCAAFESGYNPWRWEADHIFQNSAAADADNYPGSYGYGLLQWTPASYMNAAYYAARGVRPNKYINNPHSINLPGYGPNYIDTPGSTLDGRAQMIYLDTYGYVGSYYNSGGTYGNMEPTFADFKASTRPASDLCEVWVTNFERPQDPSGNRPARQALAPLLYDLISGVPPTKALPIWLLFKMRENNFRR